VGENELHAVRSDAAAELEPLFDDNGKVTGSSYESLTVAWFVTGGKLNGGRSVYLPVDGDCATQQDCPLKVPSNDVSTVWVSPTVEQLQDVSTDQSVTFYAVIRDDRGGVSWQRGTARTP